MKNFNVIFVVGIIVLSIVFIGFLAISQRDELSQNEEEIVELAVAAGADREQFSADLTGDEVRDIVEQDIEDAGNLGVTGTPTIFIEGTRQSDSSLEGMRSAIDTLLGNEQIEKPITVEEFTDFNCPSCARYDLVSIQLENEYSAEEVTFVHRNYPFLQSSSDVYAWAYEAAKKQGEEIARAVRNALFTDIAGSDYSEFEED